MPSPEALAAVPLFSQASRDRHCTSTWSRADHALLGAQSVTGAASVPSILPPTGVSLSPATEPFPQKLVDKIRSGQYVPMRDLLTDNISLLQQLESFGGHNYCALPGALKPRFREVTALPSWLYCYLAYVAIRSSEPATQDMLAYARLLIRESQRHGGTGWLEYDKVFRQQAALDNTLQWNTLHPGIQASTLMGKVSGPTSFCSLCRGTDHTAVQCALVYFQNPANLPHATMTEPFQRSRPLPRRYPESLVGICVSWNKGRCSFPNVCKFRHVCATCHKPHMAKDCTSTPASSEYKTDICTPIRAPAPYSRL